MKYSEQLSHSVLIRLKLAIFFVIAILFLAHNVAKSQNLNVPVTGCDKAAADPWDSHRVADGVPFEKIQGSHAVKICGQAIEKFPSSLRLLYQYGRSVMAREWKWLKYPDINPTPWIKKTAEYGYAPAQYQLGYLYENGYVQNKENYDKAKYWYAKAAEQGYAPAQYSLGYAHTRKYSLLFHRSETDYDKAVQWLQKAADQGYDKAQYKLGNIYNDNKKNYLGIKPEGFLNYKQAAYWYKKAAKRGNDKAQTELGYLFYTGKGVDKDYTKAAGWYRKAVKQNNIFAMEDLATLYLRGLGVKRSIKQASFWFEKAANKGNPSAQIKLGYFYLKGLEFPQDKEKGYKWLKIGSQSKQNVIAKLDLAVLTATGEGTAPNPNMALLYLNEIINTTTDNRIKQIAEKYSRKIHQMNPEATGNPKEWFSNKSRKRTKIGLGDVLIGLVFLDMVLGDDNRTGNQTYSTETDLSTIPYGDDIPLNNATEIADYAILFF